MSSTTIEAVISDFGGVLTSPLLDSFMAFQDSSGISLEELGAAMGALSRELGANPLFELETGRMTEARFLGLLSSQLTSQLGREVALQGFGERYFEHLHPNEQMIGYMRDLRARGYKLAICTNNVREWEQLWRAKLPVDEIFEVVVDSAFVGTRKPERRIYEMTLERLVVSPEAALLIDDIELNCDAARELGIEAIWFRSNDQTMGEIEDSGEHVSSLRQAGPSSTARGTRARARDSAHRIAKAAPCRGPAPPPPRLRTRPLRGSQRRSSTPPGDARPMRGRH
jgi:epoxide hydrolase-like predicted phosphatase